MKTRSRSPSVLACALSVALAYATLAQVGCGNGGSRCLEASFPCDPGPAGVGGASGAGGASGTGGAAGAGGSAGTGGQSGTGGAAGNAPNADVIVCGGIATIKCPESMYCEGECGGDRLGFCMPRPDTCPRDCPGACGCGDGKFYCNACVAHRAGTDDLPLETCSDAGN